MTTYTGVDCLEVVKTTKLTTATISGTVTKGGSGVKRRITCWKNSFMLDLHAETWSDESTGNYSLSVTGSSLDVFHVVCHGEDGENDEVYAHVVPIED